MTEYYVEYFKDNHYHCASYRAGDKAKFAAARMCVQSRCVVYVLEDVGRGGVFLGYYEMDRHGHPRFVNLRPEPPTPRTAWREEGF